MRPSVARAPCSASATQEALHPPFHLSSFLPKASLSGSSIASPFMLLLGPRHRNSQPRWAPSTVSGGSAWERRDGQVPQGLWGAATPRQPPTQGWAEVPTELTLGYWASLPSNPANILVQNSSCQWY